MNIWTDGLARESWRGGGVTPYTYFMLESTKVSSKSEEENHLKITVHGKLTAVIMSPLQIY